MRRSGVLMHVSSLPGAYSIGSLGEPARLFVDKISEAGFSLWQILPLSMTDSVGSPYKSPASFGANPYLIDLPSLYEEGLLTAEELRRAEHNDGGRVNFSLLEAERIPLLRLAAERVVDRSEIIAYVEARAELSRAAYFLALKSANGGAPWQEWSEHVCEIDELFFWQFVQYKFYTQWAVLREYASSRGISIIGDLPIYVAEDSADVWAEPEQFLLDEKGYPTEVSGVPPDRFAAEGQLWGNPLYNWDKMKEDGYAWWRRRIEHAFTMYDGVRIDHFRAIEAYWSVPARAKSAKEGEWLPGPGKALIDAINAASGGGLVIAEDLGSITDGVRALVDYSGYPGMRVLEFGFPSDSASPHLPHNYPTHCIAYTGTHDNNTLVGYLDELDPATRVEFYSYFGAADHGEPSTGSAAFAAIRALFASTAETVIIPVQDVYLKDATARMNIPGTPEGNWGYRLAANELEELPVERYRQLNSLYHRLG